MAVYELQYVDNSPEGSHETIAVYATHELALADMERLTALEAQIFTAAMIAGDIEPPLSRMDFDEQQPYLREYVAAHEAFREATGICSHVHWMSVGGDWDPFFRVIEHPVRTTPLEFDAARAATTTEMR